MKNVFIVLLIAAIGGGVYYYFSHTQKTFTENSSELIIGKWKIDSLITVESPGSSLTFRELSILHFIDSSLKKYEFVFRRDSLVFQTLYGKIQDTSHYQLDDKKNILLWGNTDTIKTKWAITKLDTANLIVQDEDSAKFFFRKVK